MMNLRIISEDKNAEQIYLCSPHYSALKRVNGWIYKNKIDGYLFWSFTDTQLYGAGKSFFKGLKQWRSDIKDVYLQHGQEVNK